MINTQVDIFDTDIFISNGFFKKDLEIEHVFRFDETVPVIRVFEDKKLKREFRIETLASNPDLKGQVFHSSIRVFKNNAVMIDGIISKSEVEHPSWKDKNYEAIRLQPFFLSKGELENKKLIGKGLFERGLHFSGTITPLGVRAVCICDFCNKSFSIQHFHAGFSETQYFYSSDSKETLVVNYGQLENLPLQLQENVNPEMLEEVEELLPKAANGRFKYYNSFRCPYCQSPFINFEKFPGIRSKEYYGNYFINQKPILFKFEKE